MQILFSTLPASGHFHPLVPLAKALQQAGHQVTFAMAESYQRPVEDAGFRFLLVEFDFPAGVNGAELQKRQREMMRVQGAPDPGVLREMMLQSPFGGMLVGEETHRRAKALLAAIERTPPDLVVSNPVELTSCIVAERLGIPYATVQGGSGLLLRLLAGRAGATERIDQLRATVGLPPDPKLEAPWRYLNLAFAPRRFFTELPPTTHHFNFATFDQSGQETLPEWFSRLDRPIVYASLGTVFNKLIENLRAVLEGLRDEPIELVVTVGRDQDPAQLGPQPPNVHVERYIPQSLVLSKCTAAVIHGGYSTTLGALQAGLPLVMVPLAADQPSNAQRCAALGVARVVEPAELTPQLIRESLRQVLNDPSYRAAARRIQAEGEALPGMERAVALVEQLAREKRPLRRDGVGGEAGGS